MSLEEEVKEIFRKFDKLNYHGKRKDSVKYVGYDSRSTYMSRLTREDKKKKDASSN